MVVAAEARTPMTPIKTAATTNAMRIARHSPVAP